MTEIQPLHTRRAAIVAAMAAGAGGSLASGARAAPPALTGHEHDWDWLVGRWSVRHRRLKGRLVGSTDWEEFNGTSTLWVTMGGLGNVDDNLLELPGETYRAMSVRTFDAKLSQWAIWWMDLRSPDRIDPPVRGGFKDGVGTFSGDDTLNGHPIKVRFRWTEITATSAHWDQAFSPDGGATWETNWHMDFTRA